MNMFGFLLALIVLVIVGNFFILYRQYKRDRKPPVKSREESEALLDRGLDMQQRFNKEQEDAMRYVERRNKTLELYEQVRKNASAARLDLAADALDQESETLSSENAPDLQ